MKIMYLETKIMKLDTLLMENTYTVENKGQS